MRELLERRARTEAVEGFVLGAYRTFQIAIANLAESTGHDFSRYVPFDPLGAVTAQEEAAHIEPRYLPLDAVHQIVL